MKTYQGSEIRNVAVVGHAQSGKTTLIAALLHAAKMTPTQGRVADGTAATAYDEEEVRFLCLVADQIGLAIDAALNFCVSQRIKDQLKLILDLNNQVVSNLGGIAIAASGDVVEVARGEAVEFR